MPQYYPDGWVMVKVNPNLIKLFASFSGGFTQGDQWRMNSGIVKIVEKEHHYDVYGSSGSVYNCPKMMEEHLTVYNDDVLNSIFCQWEERFDVVAHRIFMKDVLECSEKFGVEYIKEV